MNFKKITKGTDIILKNDKKEIKGTVEKTFSKGLIIAINEEKDNK